MQHFARFQLTWFVAQSLGDSWASCYLSFHPRTSGAGWSLETVFSYWHIFYPAMCSFLLFLVFQLILHFPWLSIQIKFSDVFQFSLMIWNPDCQKIRLMTGHRDPVRHHCQRPVLHPCQHRVDDTVPSSDSCSGHAELQPVMSSGYTAWCNLVNKHASASTHYHYILVKTHDCQSVFTHFHMMTNWLKLVIVRNTKVTKTYICWIVC